MRHVADQHPGKQRQRGHDFKVQQRLSADPAHFLQILHAGDARHDRAENNQRDHHGDQADKAIAERLHLDRGCRLEIAVHNGQGHSDQHLPP